MPRGLPIGIGWADTFAVGTDIGTPVDDAGFCAPFPFTGKLNKLTIKLGPEQLTPEEKILLGKTDRDSTNSPGLNGKLIQASVNCGSWAGLHSAPPLLGRTLMTAPGHEDQFPPPRLSVG